MGIEGITSFIMNWLQLIVLAAGGVVFNWMRGEIKDLKDRVEVMGGQIVELKIQYGNLDTKFVAIYDRLSDIKNETRDLKNAFIRLLTERVLTDSSKEE